jgi:hypothetical protein
MTDEAETPALDPAVPEPDRWKHRRRMAYISIAMLIFITVFALMKPDAAAKIETTLTNLAYTFGFIVAVGYMGAATFSHVGKK